MPFNKGPSESSLKKSSRLIFVFAYLAFKDFAGELNHELKNKKAVSDRLFISPDLQSPLWAQCLWYDVEEVPISSIGDAVKALKTRGKWWAPYSFDYHRRCQLIQDQLPKYKIPRLDFQGPLPTQAIGAWTLLEKNRMLIGAKTSSPFPHGEIHFNEDKETPPSRAYLKLWELFTIYGGRPPRGSRCLDLGSCPGGWTWVLQQTGAHVISVDKAPLDPKVALLPNIEYRKKDAFLLAPEEVGKIDYLFSDIICYPARLLELISRWQKSGLCKNFVCTIKFQGHTDWESLEQFKKIPHSRLVHLFHNKHEVTIVISP